MEMNRCKEIERSIIKRYRKSIWRPFIRGIQEYDMIQDGDKIAVCISGGKDSMLLAKLMQELQRHTEAPFELTFLVMDPGYNPRNRALIEENAKLLGIPVTIFESDIFDVTVQVEKSPCYLCARMRRGFLYDRAQELGCTGTHYMNAHGLHHDDHYTTARDMAKIAATAMQYPIFEEIFTTSEYTVPATNLSEARELKTTNFLIRSNGYPNVVDSRVLGGKTGNTSKAGRCLVALAEKNGMKLLSVVLGAKASYGPDGYSFTRYGNFEETSNLLDFAYKRFTTMQVLNPTQVGGQFPVSGGAHNAFGSISQGMSAAVPLEADYNTIRYEYTLNEGGLTAPISQGEKIGLVRVWYGNVCLAQQDLLAAADVQKAKSNGANRQNGDDNSLDLWNGILKIVLGVVAGLFVLVVTLRIVNTVRYRNRKKRKAAAKRRRR